MLKYLAYTLYIINKKIKVEMEMKRIYVKPHVEQHTVLIEKLLTEAATRATTQNLNRMTIHCGNKMKNGQINLKISLSEERILNSSPL